MSTASLTESLRDTAAVFDEMTAPQTTPEVASTLDVGRRTAYDRLERLAEAGVLDTKKVGANARLVAPERLAGVETGGFRVARHRPANLPPAPPKSRAESVRHPLLDRRP